MSDAPVSGQSTKLVRQSRRPATTRPAGEAGYGLGEAEGAAGADPDGAADAEVDGAADAGADAEALAGADSEAEAEAVADGDASADADALGLVVGFAVRRPPLPSSSALRRIATNTATVAITNTFE